MPCPDEDTIVELMEGQLSSERATELQYHIDRCDACTSLLPNLARLYGAAPEAPSTAPRHTSSPVSRYTPRSVFLSSTAPGTTPSGSELRRSQLYAANLRVQAAMSCVHLVGSVLWLPRWLQFAADAPLATLPTTWLSCWTAWAALGLLWTPLNVFGLWRQARWARASTLGYAWLSLPTLFGTPAALFALLTFRKP
jgi:hypothetical protein